MTNPGAGILQAVSVTKTFDGVCALRDVSMLVRQRAIVGVIGPNGSGKTTLLNCMSGVLRPTAGRILFDGRQIEGRPPHAIARAGVIRTFQNIRLFGRLTCLRNIEVSALAAGSVPRRDANHVARRLLSEFGLEHAAGRYADTLSYGDQRRLEIARALAARPRFLLLDEPAAGMNEIESDALRASIDGIRLHHGCGVLLIDHDLRLIMRLCDEVYVLNQGEVICHGAPEAVQADAAVVAAYIGEEPDRHSDTNVTAKESET